MAISTTTLTATALYAATHPSMPIYTKTLPTSRHDTLAPQIFPQQHSPPLHAQNIAEPQTLRTNKIKIKTFWSNGNCPSEAEKLETV